MDAETVDVYVEATLDEPRAVLMEALRRLGRHHAGPYRPAPAVVIDRCYAVRLEMRDKEQPEARIQLPVQPPRGFTYLNAIEAHEKAIALALREGWVEESPRVQFHRRHIEKLQT